MIKQYEPLIRQHWNSAVTKALANGHIGPGKLCSEFESALQTKYGYKNVILTTSGTVALMIVMRAMLGEGKKRILAPAYTFLAGHNAAKFLGYQVDLCDVDPKTLCLKSSDVWNELNRAEIQDKKPYDLVLFVNHNAYNDHDEIWAVKKACSKFGVEFLEDSSQCINVRYLYDDKFCGTMGDTGILSFSVPKLLTTGQGGAIITSDDDLADSCRRLIDHGGGQWRKTRIHEEIGINLRMTDLQAAYGLAQLEDIEELYTAREENHFGYHGKLAERYLSSPSGWMCLYRCYKHNGAKELCSKLSAAGVEAKQYYVPIHWNASYLEEFGKYPNTEYTYNNVVYLPSSLSLSARDIEKICNYIEEFDE